MTVGPLPFRLHEPGEDNMGAWGIESISYRADGLLHLTDQGVTLEWTETRTHEQVSIDRVGTDVETFPREGVDLSVSQLAGAWVAGGWWRPRLELRVRLAQDLEGVPGKRGVTRYN